MDVFSNLILGFQTALVPINLLYCFIGVLLGTLIGVLPGIGPTATIAMLLPITFSLPANAAIIMLAGIYYGAQYGGSTTAILINIPGEASSAVTAIDGYQMAHQGRAGPALAIAAIGSFAAGTISTLVVAILAPMLTELALKFGPAEYFSLIVLGLVAAAALAHGSLLKAIAMILVGLLLGLIGTDKYTAVPRFTFDFIELLDGINVVAVAVGIFGIVEILRNLEDETERSVLVKKVTGLMPTRADLLASTGPILRGTAIGSLLGVLPGGGALLASFASYTMEKKLSRTPERFGKGAIEGVAGPESANNAGAQTSFIPMLTLGIPSNAVMALMVAAMMLQGVAPGPNIVTQKPDLFWGLIASMWIGNFMLVLLNLPLIGIWVKLLTIPYYALFPFIMVFSAIGIFSISSNAFDLYTFTVFGLLGYLLAKFDCEPTPLLLGFILGPLLEEHLLRSMLVGRGSAMIFLTRPISAGLLLVAALLLVVMCLPNIAKKREQVFAEKD